MSWKHTTLRDEGGGDGGGGGAGALTIDQWRDALPQEIRDNPTIQQVKDIPSLAGMLIHAEAKVGADKIVVPGKNASDAEWAAYWSKLGRPDAADGYEIPTDNMPEGVQLQPDLTKGFFEEFHRLGVSKKQAAGIMRKYAGFVAEQQAAAGQAHEEAYNKAVGTLKTEWGDAYEQNVALANNAIKAFAGDDYPEVQKVLQGGLGVSPVLTKLFHRIGRTIAEDELLGGGGSQPFVMSPAEAKGKLEALQQDEDFQKALNDKQHPGHKAAVQKKQELFEVIHGKKRA